MWATKEFLESLKVGDMVGISHGGISSNYSTTKVVRLTKTQIVTDTGSREEKFNRITGRAVGNSSWHGRWLVPPDHPGLLRHRATTAVKQRLSRIDALVQSTKDRWWKDSGGLCDSLDKVIEALEKVSEEEKDDE